MEALNKYLKQFPQYTPKVFEIAKPFLSRKKLEAGEFFLSLGKISNQIAFIEKGLFRVYYLNDGKEITHCFCRENSIACSYRSLITQQPSDTAIQAVEPTEIIYFSNESLQKLYQQDPFWQQVGRIASENEYVTTECHNRFVTDLSATERYQEIMENDPELLQRVPLNYLATYIQVAPETLSRIRKKLTRT